MNRQKFIPAGDAAMRPESVGLTWPRSTRSDDMRKDDSGACVAVIRVCGPLEHHMGSWFDSYESILGRIEGAMQHEDVTAIILDIDSPGGEVSGLQETVRKIRAMRQSYDKPLVAYANDEAYSAAYALACSADEIYLPEGGGVGSIGVLAELCDQTEMAEMAGVRVEVVRSGNRKAEGHPFIPLTDATIARVQSRVDDLAKQFFKLVSEVRPTTRKDLESLQGACVFGQKAVNAGLADGVASFDEVMASFLKSSTFDSGQGNVIDSPINEDVDMNFKVLEQKVASTLMALNDASLTPATRKKAVAAYAAAQSALTEAKVKKTYEKKTTETETEEDDGEKDKDPPPDDSSAAAVEDDEDEEKADEEKKGKKAKAVGSLEAFVKSLTGQSSSRAAQQVLESMREQAEQNASNAVEIKKLKADAERSKLNAMVAEGVAAGKIKPAQVAWAKTQTATSLKSYLDATPAMFAPRQAAIGSADLSTEATEAPDSDGLTSFERSLCSEQGISVESYKKQRAASNGAPVVKVN